MSNTQNTNNCSLNCIQETPAEGPKQQMHSYLTDDRPGLCDAGHAETAQLRELLGDIAAKTPESVRSLSIRLELQLLRLDYVGHFFAGDHALHRPCHENQGHPSPSAAANNGEGRGNPEKVDVGWSQALCTGSAPCGAPGRTGPTRASEGGVVTHLY